MLKKNVKTVTWQFYVINPHNHTFQSVQEQRIALLINIFINSKISPKFLHEKKGIWCEVDMLFYEVDMYMYL